MKFTKQKIQKNVSLAHGSIRWILLTEIAFKNLFYKKLRTGLTIMGVVIGVGAVVFLLAFGFGLRNVVTDQVVDSNTIRTVDIETAKAELVKLNEETTDKITQIEHVSSVAKVYSVAGNTSFGNSNIESVVYAVDQNYLNLADLKVTNGSPPKFNSDKDIFVNSSYVKAIGIENSEELVGKELEVTYDAPVREGSEEEESGATSTEQVFVGKVTSILETGSGAEVYVSGSVFEASGFENANQLKVLVKEQDQVTGVQRQIEGLGLLTNSPLSTLEQIDQIFAFLNLLFLGFGGIGLIIAVLGMFNTLTISLLERTKEIGLMITLGARRKDIRRLFMVEAVGLSLIGGLSGAVAAFMISRVVDVVLNSFAKSRGVTDTFTIFAFKPVLLLAVLIFSSALGLAVVYLPAKRAANINPIEALKS
jgi:putative ABC transport system permease protein